MSQALPLAFISMPGGLEWVVILLVALLLFGKRLPSIAKSLGQTMHEFKSGLAGNLDEDANKEKKNEDKTVIAKNETTSESDKSS